MTAVRYDDVATVPLEPAPKQTSNRAAKRASKRHPQPPIAAGDPLTEAATHLLSIPVRQLYAALWRAGVIEVRA
jgi:hypothetical protein